MWAAEEPYRIAGVQSAMADLQMTPKKIASERAAALSVLDELQVLCKQRYVSPLDIALVYTGLGDRNSAFQWRERAYGERVMRIQELGEPHFDSLRPDPRFEDLLQRIGLPPSTSTESRPID